jgi:uncharacterized FlgJ-related protein
MIREEERLQTKELPQIRAVDFIMNSSDLHDSQFIYKIFIIPKNCIISSTESPHLAAFLFTAMVVRA